MRSKEKTSSSRFAISSCRSRPKGFLLSFSLPNFHFHATTAYDILRMKGVQVGKRDYLGKMRVVKS